MKKNKSLLGYKLNKHQAKHLNSLKWFLSRGENVSGLGKARATGRSFLTDLLLIEQALKNPGAKILLFDHWDLVDGAIESRIYRLRSRISNFLFGYGFKAEDFEIKRENYGHKMFLIIPELSEDTKRKVRLLAKFRKGKK